MLGKKEQHEKKIHASKNMWKYHKLGESEEK